MVMGASRFLLTLTGRLEMRTNDLATVVGSALGCGECGEGGGGFVTG